MKTLKNIVRHLVRPTVLAVIGLILSTAVSQAARIDLVVTVGNNVALVVPGSNTGGRLVWSSADKIYITDRVSRGEAVRVFYWPTRAGEYAVQRGYTTTCGTMRYGSATLVSDVGWTVPTNPSCDNLRPWIQSNFGYTEMRLPIGTRP